MKIANLLSAEQETGPNGPSDFNNPAILDDSKITVGRDLLCLFLGRCGEQCRYLQVDLDVISNVDRRLMHAHHYYDAPPRLRNVIKEVGWHEADVAGQ